MFGVVCFGEGEYLHDIKSLAKYPNGTTTTCQLASGKLIKIRLDCISNRPHNLHYYALQGTKGCYEAPRGLGDQHKIWLIGMDEDTDHATWRPLQDFYNAFMPQRYKDATEEQKATGHWGGDFFVVEDFVNAIITGEKPAVDVYDACEWTAVGLLSEVSITNGGKPIEVPNFRKNQSAVR